MSLTRFTTVLCLTTVYLLSPLLVFGQTPWERCRDLVLRAAPATAILSAEELEHLHAWAGWNSFHEKGYVGATLLEEHTYLLASELSKRSLRSLLMEGNTPRPRRKVEVYLRGAGMHPMRTPALDNLLTYFYRFTERDPSSAFSSLENQINRVRSLPAAEVTRLRSEIEARMRVREIMALLSDRASYRLKVTDKEVVTVMGVRYPLKKRKWNKELVITVPTEKILSDSSNPQYRDADYSSRRVDANLTPEGRVYVPRPNDFARALVYGGGASGQVDVTLTPNKDGNFYGLTHIELIGSFSPSWVYDRVFNKPEKELEQILDKVRVDPVGFINELYDSRRGPRGF